MKNKPHLIFTFYLLVFLSGLEAQTVRVGGNGFDLPSNGEYRTLNCAIEGMSPGTTVLMREGRYYESVNISKPCVLTSVGGKGGVVIGEKISGTNKITACSRILPSTYFLTIFKNNTWDGQIGHFEFNGIEGFHSWNDNQNDELSSFKYEAPATWELRIHKHRDPASSYKAWRGLTGQVNQNELPGFLHDEASGHSWLKLGSVYYSFDKIEEKDADRMLITKNNPNLSFPLGYKDGKKHQQSIQKTTDGRFVVTGSAANQGYIYFTDPNRNVVKIVTPEELGYTNNRNYDHLGGCQVTENILAVGYERLESESEGTSQVLFFDISDVQSPKFLDHLTIDRNTPNSTAGAVGLIRLEDSWLVTVGNWGSERLDFYQSMQGNLLDKASSFNPNPIASWTLNNQGFGPGSVDGNWGSYQNINVLAPLNQPATLSNIWMIGMHTEIIPSLRDWADLYYINLSDGGAKIVKKFKKHFKRSGSGPRFIHGSGVFRDPTNGAIEVYAIEAKMQERSDGRETSRCNVWR